MIINSAIVHSMMMSQMAEFVVEYIFSRLGCEIFEIHIQKGRKCVVDLEDALSVYGDDDGISKA